jgi:ketosteroid isomerase-like protein
MSHDNVEVVRRGFEAMNSGDPTRMDPFIHPDFEVEIPSGVSAEPDTYRGYEGLRRYFRSFEDAMEEIRFRPERFWDAGDRVVVTVHLSARGKNTGIPVEQRTTQVWTIRDGKALRNEVYSDAGEALEAAGLRAAGFSSDE